MAAAIELYVCQNGLNVLHTDATHIRVTDSGTEPTSYDIAVNQCIAYKSFGPGLVFWTAGRALHFVE